MEEPTETPSPKLATVEDLPPELFDHILAKLPRKSLSSIRLVWPRLDPLILPRLFSTFHFAMRRRDIERFCKVASSPHLSHCVQQVQWYELRVHWEREINELEKRFYAALDAMPNLHTFVTEFVPDVKVVGARQHLDPDGTTSRQRKPRYYEYADFEGYLWEPGPAMLRPESRITTIKCLNLGDLPARWFKPLWDAAHMPKLESSVTPRHYPDIISTDSQLCADFKLYIWKDDVQNILDAGHFPLCRHSDRHDCQHSQLNQVMDLILHHPADEPLTVSLRFTQVSWFPTCYKMWTSRERLSLRWENLQTLSLTLMVFPVHELAEFICGHATTLKHLFLYECSGMDASLAKAVRLVAASQNVHLHRFVVGIRGGSQTQPEIIPERKVLEFVNSKDETKNPFPDTNSSRRIPNSKLLPGGQYVADTWGTVELIRRISNRLSDRNNDLYVCKQCNGL